jgi:hypothetical protein
MEDLEAGSALSLIPQALGCRILNRRQARAICPSTRETYEAFMKQAKMEPVVEEIGEDARLLWIGHRQTDRVLLYFHGTFGEALSFHAPFSSSDWE